MIQKAASLALRAALFGFIILGAAVAMLTAGCSKNECAVYKDRLELAEAGYERILQTIRDYPPGHKLRVIAEKAKPWAERALAEGRRGYVFVGCCSSYDDSVPACEAGVRSAPPEWGPGRIKKELKKLEEWSVEES